MVEIEEITRMRAPIERCFDLARNVEVHLAGNVHWGEQAVALEGITSGLAGLGQRVTWRARHFGIRWKLTSEITAMDQPVYFQDTMVRGPFGFMRHDHYFASLSDGQTEMRDCFAFAAPLGMAGVLVERMFLRRYMQKLLHERCEAIRRFAESDEWRRYL